MKRIALTVCLVMSGWAGSASAQSPGGVINDICMMPKASLLADPFSPQSVPCLSAAEVLSAKSTLRAQAAKTPGTCGAVAALEFGKDPYAPRTVACRTDVQISQLVTALQRPKPGIDDTCMRANDALRRDPYGPTSVACHPTKTINTVADLRKKITVKEREINTLHVELNRTYAGN